MRGDFPWLAYHREEQQAVAEGVRLDPLQVKVFRTERIPALPHFERMSQGVAFQRFWYDPCHIAGRFSVLAAGVVSGRLSAEGWEGKPVRWFVQNLKSREIIAEGRQPALNFKAGPGKDYLLVAVQIPGHDLTPCPLCRGEWVF